MALKIKKNVEGKYSHVSYVFLILVGIIYLVSATTIEGVVLTATSTDNLTTDNLTATVSVTPSNTSILYEWYKDSVLSAVFLGNSSFQNTIPYWFTTLGDVWYVNATPKNLTNNYNISNASYVDILNVSVQDTVPRGMAFNNDGTKLYVVGNDSDAIYEYNLSTAFDVSTGTLVQNFSISAEETNPTGMAFNNDGTKMYVIGVNSLAISEYNLSTAFNVSTGTLVQNFSVSSEDTVPEGMAFNNDGIKMYMVGRDTDTIYEYDLSTAFNVSTGTLVQNFSVSAQETIPTGMAFNNDGTKVYIIGNGNDRVYGYNLSTAFNVSTGTFVQNFSVAEQETVPTGMAFNDDGTKMYVVGDTNESINEYDVGSAQAGTSVTSGNLTIINETISTTDTSTTEDSTTDSTDSTGSTALTSSITNYSWDKTYHEIYGELSEEESLEMRLGENERVRMKINGRIHHIGVIELTDTNVSIEVASIPQEATLRIGEERKFEVNEDNYHDILVKLNDIVDGEAHFTISYINKIITKQLFDITFKLDDLLVQSSDELSGIVTFESFGTEPTPVYLVFILFDEFGNEIYKIEIEHTVRTEAFVRWNYENDTDLPEGKYNLVLSVLYGAGVFEEFIIAFEIREEKEITVDKTFWIVVFVIGLLVIIGLSLWLFFRRRLNGSGKMEEKEVGLVPQVAV